MSNNNKKAGFSHESQKAQSIEWYTPVYFLKRWVLSLI